jgi:DNA-binding transcriptional MerR regulator
MTDDDSKKFNIQLAASLSGVSAHTIRAWEKRYQVLTPMRTSNGRRLYTQEEINRLTILSQLTHLGSNISQIAQLSEEDLKATYHRMVYKGNQMFTQTLATKEVDINETQLKLLKAVENYQVDIISILLSQAKNALPPKTFAMEIIKPLLREVNHRKSEGVYQNAQLQALYAIVKFHAGNIIYSHFERSSKPPRKYVLTSVEREHHSFTLLISALLCCHHKKHFIYLNSNLPAVSIIDAVKATEANTLILSLPEHYSAQKDILALINNVIEEVSAKASIWLVGNFESGLINNYRWKNTRQFRSDEELDEALGSAL